MSIESGGYVPPEYRPTESVEKSQSSREYGPSRVIENDITVNRVVFEKRLKPETDVCLIGDGQGADTRLFLDMGVKPEHLKSVNYEQSEVDAANSDALAGTAVEMHQADAADLESLKKVGLNEATQDLIVLMHVLEVPNIKGETERNLVENIARLLKEDGEALVTQYKKKLTPEEAESFGVEEIAADSLQRRFGDDWQKKFKEEYGQEWHDGMRYSEISNIRSKEELLKLFADRFDIKLEEDDNEYVLKMRKKTEKASSS